MCDRDLEAVLMALGTVNQDKPNPNKDIAKAVDQAWWGNYRMRACL